MIGAAEPIIAISSKVAAAGVNGAASNTMGASERHAANTANTNSNDAWFTLGFPQLFFLSVISKGRVFWKRTAQVDKELLRLRDHQAI